ncbi:AMP-dependent synthetase/ligase, partial [Trinorchestia longiramus]
MTTSVRLFRHNLKNSSLSSISWLSTSRPLLRQASDSVQALTNQEFVYQSKHFALQSTPFTRSNTRSSAVPSSSVRFYSPESFRNAVPANNSCTRAFSVSSKSRDSANPQRFAQPLEWSYASLNGEQPLLGLTMGEVILRARDQFGDREAVVSVAQARRQTYDQLFHDSLGVAAGLLASGLQVGDRVGLWSGNCYEWIVTQWAAGLAGLVL